jgi:hypothetical protein
MLSNHPNCLGGNGPSASSDLIGDVDGPASATDNAVARFDGTTGKLIQNSVVTIADSTGAIAGASSLTSPAATDLTLGTGTFGTALTVASATGAVTATTTLADQGGTIAAQRNGLAPAQGLVFDGTTPASQTGSNTAFGTANFTLSARVRVNTIGARQAIFGGSSSAALIITAAGGLRLEKAGVAGACDSTGLTLIANTWFDIALTCTSQVYKFYVNGVATSDGGSTAQNFTSSIIYVGSNFDTATDLLSGIIRPVGIYNRALSAAEVLALYQSSAPAGADYPTTVAGTDYVVNGNFSSSTGWNVGTAWTIAAGVATTNGTGDGGGSTELYQNGKSFKAGQRVRVTYTLAGVSSGSFRIIFYGGTSNVYTTARTANGTYTEEVTLTGGATTYQTTNNGSPLNNGATLDNISVVSLGLLLAPDSAQAGAGLAWYDTSGNAANITLPATGVSWSLPTSGKAFSLSLASTTSASSATVGAFLVGNGTAATNVAIGGGKIVSGDVFNSVKTGNGAQNAFGFATASATGWTQTSIDVNDANGGIIAPYIAGFAPGYLSANATGLLLQARTGSLLQVYNSNNLGLSVATGVGGTVTINSSTAGSAGAGALVVTGGLSAGAASYFGGTVTTTGNVTIGASGAHSLSFTATNNSGTDETQSIIVNDPSYSVQSARIDLNKESFQRGSIKFYTQNGTGTNALALTLSTTQAATFAGAVTANNDITTTIGKFATTASGQSVGMQLDSYVNAGSFNNYILNNSSAAGTYAALNFGRTTGVLYGFLRVNNNTEAMEIGTAATVRLTIASTGAATFAGTVSPQQATTAAAPAYVKGAIYFDTTLNKLRVGGATAWETITSV